METTSQAMKNTLDVIGKNWLIQETLTLKEKFHREELLTLER